MNQCRRWRRAPPPYQNNFSRTQSKLIKPVCGLIYYWNGKHVTCRSEDNGSGSARALACSSRRPRRLQGRRLSTGGGACAPRNEVGSFKLFLTKYLGLAGARPSENCDAKVRFSRSLSSSSCPPFPHVRMCCFGSGDPHRASGHPLPSDGRGLRLAGARPSRGRANRLSPAFSG